MWPNGNGFRGFDWMHCFVCEMDSNLEEQLCVLRNPLFEELFLSFSLSPMVDTTIP